MFSLPIRIIIIGVIALLVLLITPFYGAYNLDFDQLSNASSQDYAVFMNLRLPRLLTAFLAGAGLAWGGAAFQALFRNPLADPYTLGISAGAAVGVALGIHFGLPGIFYLVNLFGGELTAASVNQANHGTGVATVFGALLIKLGGVSFFAFLGAMLATFIVWLIVKLRSEFSTTALLLAGVAISAFFSAIIMLLQVIAAPHDLAAMVRLLSGSVVAVGFSPSLFALPFIIGTGLYLFTHAQELDLIACGDDLAATRGVEVIKLRQRLFFIVSLMIGAIVALCGPIGFVGLMAPHACRLLVSARHRLLLPMSGLFGGTFLVFADFLARMLFRPSELPVGILTAFCGGPFFLYLLLRSPR